MDRNGLLHSQALSFQMCPIYTEFRSGLEQRELGGAQVCFSMEDALIWRLPGRGERPEAAKAECWRP